MDTTDIKETPARRRLSGVLNATRTKQFILHQIERHKATGRIVKTTRISADMIFHLEAIVIGEIQKQIGHNAQHNTMKPSTAETIVAPRRQRTGLL